MPPTKQLQIAYTTISVTDLRLVNSSTIAVYYSWLAGAALQARPRLLFTNQGKQLTHIRAMVHAG